MPVIDGVGAAVRLAEAVVGLGLRTSKVSTYAQPEPKQIIAWPLSAALGLAPVPAPARGAPVTGLIDLASRWLGGSVLAASDESFGEKEHLLAPGPAGVRARALRHRGARSSTAGRPSAAASPATTGR